MNELTLQNTHGCIDELEACSRGLTYADHLWAEVIDDLDNRQETFDSYESIAAKEIRLSLPSGATATEVKAAINEWFEKRPVERKARDELREAERRKVKLERFFRTLEKRIGSAQAARNGHELLAKAGGG